MEKILIAGLMLILLVGCTAQGPASEASTGKNIGTPGTPTAGGNASGASPSSATTGYSLADVSKHSTAGDCWVVVNSKVYDITKLAAAGGHAVPYSTFCGKDASTEFNTRPLGSGTPHPQKASDKMANFYIGDVAN